MTLSELPERTATGQAATIYSELRSALGIPNVNLVFRHMATVSGCLPWAWRCLGPLYGCAEIHEAAAALTALARPDDGPRRHNPFGASSVAARDTLDSYIRANPVNMLGLAVLDLAVRNLGVAHRAVDGRTGAAAGASVKVRTAVTAIDEILPMPDLATLPAESVERLRQLARMVHGDDGAVIPSLFRHFVPWPAALGAIEEVVRALVNSGQLDAISGAMIERCKAAAAALPVDPPGSADPAVAQTIHALAKLFPRNMAKMTVVALVLRQTWSSQRH